MEINNILKMYYLLFSKKGTPRKRAGVRTAWTPPRSAPDYAHYTNVCDHTEITKQQKITTVCNRYKRQTFGTFIRVNGFQHLVVQHWICRNRALIHYRYHCEITRN